jgi:hypothetical protein
MVATEPHWPGDRGLRSHGAHSADAVKRGFVTMDGGRMKDSDPRLKHQNLLTEPTLRIILINATFRHGAVKWRP